MPADPTAHVGPDDPRYPALVRGFNLRWVGSPAFVQLCDSTEDVRAAVQHAVDHDLRVTVRGGGHCYEDFVSGNDGGMIIDLTPMHDVGFDAAAGAYVIEGGCTLWNVYWNLYRRYGVALPAGSCYSVGAGGHITGGGYGLLARLHGLTVDHLDAVEVVHVGEDRQARVVVVARDSADEDERGLLWAHQGGGGGNFGVVTRFFFRELPRAPSEAHLVTMAWNWKNPDGTPLGLRAFAAIVRNYGEFFAAHSAVGSPYSGLFALLHLFQSANGQITLAAQYVGDEPERLDDFVAAMCGGAAPPPVAPRAGVGYHATPPPTISPRCLPWLYATQLLDGSGPNQRGKYKSAYMRRPFPTSRSRSSTTRCPHRRTPTARRSCRSIPTAARSTPPLGRERRSGAVFGVAAAEIERAARAPAPCHGRSADAAGPPRHVASTARRGAQPGGAAARSQATSSRPSPSRASGIERSPASAAASASRFSAPVASSSVRRAARTTGSVSVMRSGGGFGEPRTGATGARLTSSTGWPGNSEHVCPSGPMPSRTMSRTASGTCSSSARPYSQAASSGTSGEATSCSTGGAARRVPSSDSRTIRALDCGSPAGTQRSSPSHRCTWSQAPSTPASSS